jgi:probable rRNA maturation factor
LEIESPPELREAVAAALAACGIAGGHVGVQLVDAEEMRRLNRDHRGVDAPTDVLAFPVDGLAPSAGPRELGDVVICAEHAADLEEAVVHGILHLAGHDHETDAGEMLRLQDEIVARLRAA